MTNGEYLQELRDDAKSVNIRLDISIDGTYVTLYHGTSKKIADEIRRTKIFKDGFFFSKKSKSMYGDSVNWYARNRGEKDGSGPEVLTMKVDPRSFFVNIGTAELESRGDLYLWSDNIWRNRKQKTDSVFDFKPSKEIAELMNIESLQFVQNFAMSMLRHKYWNLKIRNKTELLSEFKNELKNFLEKGEDRPRWLSVQAKTWNCNKEEFVENINKFLKLKSLDILIKTEDKKLENYIYKMKNLKNFENYES